MKKQSRILLVLAALLLVPVYWAPIWSIGVVAPQYSDGLGMYIMIDDVVGHGPHDIQNLNIINHYIGMQPIVPEEVSVLDIMPWALGFLIGFALLVGLVGNRKLLYGWLASFTVLGAAGMVEFYRWLYDYGHNLDPMAPIKVPGMTYMPPLVGREQLLNMTASSWPSWGTLFLTLGFAAGMVAVWRETGPWRLGERVRRFSPKRRHAAKLAPSAAVIAVLLLGAVACADADDGDVAAMEEEEVSLVGLTDAHCGGVIEEPRFGGIIVDGNGETHSFRSAECLIAYVNENNGLAESARSIRVIDYSHGSRLIDAHEATYVPSEFRPGPDELNILVTDNELHVYNFRRFFGGEAYDWEGIRDMMAERWPDGHPNGEVE